MFVDGVDHHGDDPLLFRIDGGPNIWVEPPPPAVVDVGLVEEHRRCPGATRLAQGRMFREPALLLGGVAAAGPPGQEAGAAGGGDRRQRGDHRRQRAAVGLRRHLVPAARAERLEERVGDRPAQAVHHDHEHREPARPFHQRGHEPGQGLLDRDGAGADRRSGRPLGQGYSEGSVLDVAAASSGRLQDLVGVGQGGQRVAADDRVAGAVHETPLGPVGGRQGGERRRRGFPFGPQPGPADQADGHPRRLQPGLLAPGLVVPGRGPEGVLAGTDATGRRPLQGVGQGTAEPVEPLGVAQDAQPAAVGLGLGVGPGHHLVGPGDVAVRLRVPLFGPAEGLRAIDHASAASASRAPTLGSIGGVAVAGAPAARAASGKGEGVSGAGKTTPQVMARATASLPAPESIIFKTLPAAGPSAVSTRSRRSRRRSSGARS